MIVNEKPKSRISKSIRIIKSNIEFIFTKNDLGKTILFTSSMMAKGKTFVRKILQPLMLFQEKNNCYRTDLEKAKLYLTFEKDDGTTNIS